MTVGKESKCRQTCSPCGSDLPYQNGLVQHLLFHRCHPKSPVHLPPPATREQDLEMFELPGLGQLYQVLKILCLVKDVHLSNKGKKEESMV